MDVFGLKQVLLDDYSAFLRSFLRIHDKRIREFVDEELKNGALWPPELLQLNPEYESASSVKELCEKGVLHAECANFFKDIRLFRHQETAIQKALAKRNYIVTTGTGSGKSLTYLIPIINHILKTNPEQKGTRAIIIYPMNALINSQLQALEDFSKNSNTRITFARYTGQENREEKERIKSQEPHIILTNFTMLEFMLIRPGDTIFFENALSTIQFLVLDELHSYRGRQGSDLSYLIRRLRHRSRNLNLQCIGTSATLATGTTRDEKNESIAAVASRIFGTVFEKEDVIDESLKRRTGLQTSPKPELDFNGEIEPESAQWKFIASWIESFYGLEIKENRMVRMSPKRITEGFEALSTILHIPVEKSSDIIIKVLYHQTSRDGTIFPFKIHQFISQGGTIHATLESTESRHLTLEGQIFYKDDNSSKYLYPIAFCRECGQEYYLVDLREKDFMLLPRNDDIFNRGDESVLPGYLLIDDENIWEEEMTQNLPDNWFDPKRKILKEFKDFVPKKLFVAADGSIKKVLERDTRKTWFLKTPFLTCLRCGVSYSRRMKSDYTKLSRLSSEGRSSATTVLTLSALNFMKDAPDLHDSAKKVMSFTDNRQDASLQAGHFNDFLIVATIRSALYKALLNNNGKLTYENVGEQTLKQMHIRPENFLLVPIDDSIKINRAWGVLKEVIEYRIVEDMARGWRINQPNLEQCGLLKFEYDGLERLATDQDVWQHIPFFSDLNSRSIEFILHTFLDQFRKNLAISTEILDDKNQENVRRRANAELNDTWAFNRTEKLRRKIKYIIPSDDRKPGRDQLSIGAQSLLGRFIRSSKHWQGREDKLTTEEYLNLLYQLLKVLINKGFIIEGSERGTKYYQLRETAILWSIGDGNPPGKDPIRDSSFETRFSEESTRDINPYYKNLYTGKGLELTLLRAREHTGQINTEDRIAFENDFRKAKISALYCSPTMELGIDIKELNMVHMRNIPPSPANYAQRSGRSGRGGQASLVVAYASSGMMHDQYFFKRPSLMVSGNVVPQRFDLTNEALVRTHLHSFWLTQIKMNLDCPITEILDIEDEIAICPLREEIKSKIRINPEFMTKIQADMRKIISDLESELLGEKWYTENWLTNEINSIPEKFDRTFDRWRELYLAARDQMKRARQMKDNAMLQRDQKGEQGFAEKLEYEAINQIQILLGTARKKSESEFYLYRYLATEGFTPGYNFPKLPVMAYIPFDKNEPEYIARARFQAISEYGPRNIIYHKGKKFRIVKSALPVTAKADPFLQAKVCQRCGHIEYSLEQSANNCRSCGVELSGDNSKELLKLFKMSNVTTQEVERITSDEEDRLREGYQITTHFSLPQNTESSKVITSNVKAENGSDLIEMTYIGTANIYKVNHGFKRGQADGFTMDVENGYWAKSGDDDSADSMEEAAKKWRGVKLFVEDTKNVLLIKGVSEEFAESGTVESFQAAFIKGIQEYFQVEDIELGIERVGSGENLRIMIYENSEGGLGILNEIIREKKLIAEIAKKIMDIMHYENQSDSGWEDSREECAQGCYDCLLAYSNQKDHLKINRHKIKPFILKLLNSMNLVGGNLLNYDEQYWDLKQKTDSRSELERKFLQHLYDNKLRLPDNAQVNLEDYFACPDFYYNQDNTCIFCDGSVHDLAEQKERDEMIRRDLKMLGYRVIVIRYNIDLATQVSSYPSIFGEAK